MDESLRQQIREREEMLDRLTGILLESLAVEVPREALDPDAPLFGTGLGLDSVDALELVVAVETEFGVTFGQDLPRTALRTLNSLLDVVRDYQRAAGAK